mmetsp:Transcript_69943/g.149740  ORF Transcript_69943/g.149740 Transcript_69943/m.149740 type:complete len:293 (+) Transcript_69943:1-879(+)
MPTTQAGLRDAVAGLEGEGEGFRTPHFASSAASPTSQAGEEACKKLSSAPRLPASLAQSPIPRAQETTPVAPSCGQHPPPADLAIATVGGAGYPSVGLAQESSGWWSCSSTPRLVHTPRLTQFMPPPWPPRLPPLSPPSPAVVEHWPPPAGGPPSDRETSGWSSCASTPRLTQFMPTLPAFLGKCSGLGDDTDRASTVDTPRLSRFTPMPTAAGNSYSDAASGRAEPVTPRLSRFLPALPVGSASCAVRWLAPPCGAGPGHEATTAGVPLPVGPHPCQQKAPVPAPTEPGWR